jgi:hypothetical protein
MANPSRDLLGEGCALGEVLLALVAVGDVVGFLEVGVGVAFFFVGVGVDFFLDGVGEGFFVVAASEC